MRAFVVVLFLSIGGIGIAKERESIAPFLSGDTFRAYAQHIYDETKTDLDPSMIIDGDIVFVKSNLAYQFSLEIAPYIEHRYILITHNDDMSMPGNAAGLLESPNLVHWFAQNVDREHPKLTGIPIGLANNYVAHGNIASLQHAIEHVAKKEKTSLLYFNFLIRTNRSFRKPIFNYFKKQSFCKKSPFLPFYEYLLDLGRCAFAVSPPGNGIDCHRTWEALYLGVIPIVEKSSLNTLFSDLPIVSVDSWEEVTEDFLLSEFENTQSRKALYHMEKLYWPYWKNEIDKAVEFAKGE